MKVQLSNADVVHLLTLIKNDMGAWFAGIRAESEVKKLPWAAKGQYVESILDNIANYYEKKQVQR